MVQREMSLSSTCTVHSASVSTCSLILSLPLQKRLDTYIEERLTTVREVETITGISFFPGLSVTEQNTLALRIVTSVEDF